MKNRILIFTIITFGLLTSLYYMRTVFPGCIDSCARVHTAIVDGTMTSPFRYRILAPIIVQAVFQPTTDVDIAVAYSIARAITLPLMFLAIWYWFSKWTAQTTAFAGVALIMAYSPIMFQVYGTSLYNPFEVIFLVAALTLLLNNRDGLLFAALTILATLNRETGVLLPLAYIALHLNDRRDRRVQLKAAAYLATSAVTYIALRLILGPAPDAITVTQIFEYNFAGQWHTGEAIMNNVVLFPIWIAAAIGLRTAPQRLKHLALAGLPYFGLLLVFALWNETRLLLPLLVLWMPIALQWFERGTRQVITT